MRKDKQGEMHTPKQSKDETQNHNNMQSKTTMQNVQPATSNKTTEEKEDDQTAIVEERASGTPMQQDKVVPTTQPGKSMEDMAQVRNK